MIPVFYRHSHKDSINVAEILIHFVSLEEERLVDFTVIVAKSDLTELLNSLSFIT